MTRLRSWRLLADSSPAESPNWVCKICNNANCFNCHPSVCQYHIKMEDDESAKTIRKMSKVCPKRGCGRRLMRSGGCAHMTCQIIAGERFIIPARCGKELTSSGNGCGTEWCWSCKAIWVSGQRGHIENCPWRVSPPIPAPSPSDPLYAPSWNIDPGYDTKYDEGLWIPSSYR